MRNRVPPNHLVEEGEEKVCNEEERIANEKRGRANYQEAFAGSGVEDEIKLDWL